MPTNEFPDKIPAGGQPVTDESLLKIAKEVAIKFIEIGRITPATFSENFDEIYRTIETTVRRKG
jgi:hypothetical protein